MKLSCIIVDDEPLSHKVLQSHIGRIPGLEIKAFFFNAPDARKFLADNPVDILLLDIQMPEMTGLELLRSLEHKPVTILTTAFREFAFEGFELGVIDYLLKPVQFQRFESAIGRAAAFVKLSGSESVLEDNRSGQTALLVKTGTKKRLVAFQDIIYVQGLKDYTIIYTESEKYVVKGSVKATAALLPDALFLRVHKSFIVAVNRIKIVSKNKIELDNVHIPVGRRYKTEVDKLLK